MTTTQRLEQIFGFVLQEQPSIAALRQFHTNSAYCCNEDGEVIGICISESKQTSLSIPKDLQELQYLNLSDNRSLEKLEFEVGLPQLVHLDVSDSRVISLIIPAGFKKLEWLDLSRNQLKELKLEGIFPALHYLDITSNQLKEIVIPAPKLKLLYLNNNKLKKLHFQTIPESLETMQLRNNQLEELPGHLQSLHKLKVLYLDGNPLSEISQEIIGKGEHHNVLTEVRLYLQGLEKSGGQQEYLHQAKMVLVGNGRVGKTSICKKLIDKEAPLPEDDERTLGLELTLYSIDNLDPGVTQLESPIDFIMNIWDFGGQGKYREIQQLFCSRKTLYLFVTSDDDRPGINEDYVGFDYWLSMVNAYSYDAHEQSFSPVIHVVNKIDQKEKRIDMNEVEQFKNVKEFVRISCETLEHFNELEQAIRKTLPNISKNVFKDRYPKEWIAVKKELEEIADGTDDNYISFDRYLKICDDKLSEEEAKNWLIILDRIGTIIYFGDNKLLKDWIILNPQWIKEALFNVLDSPLIKNGILGSEYFKFIWPEIDFSKEEYPKLIELMKKYKLCYEKPDQFEKMEYVLPVLLSDTEPKFPGILQKPSYSFKVKYKPFLPAGNVNKMMVEMQSAIFQNLVWKNNVVIHDEGFKTYAHIWEDWQNKSVYFNLYGEHPNIIYQSIISKLTRLNEELVNTMYLEHLEIEVFAKHEGEWDRMDTLKKFKARQFSCFWENPEIQRQINRSKPKVFISYAHRDDFRYFEGFVKGIKEYSYGEWDVFEDRYILIGEDWHKRLQKEVNECDFAIFLLSPNFFTSKYIRNNEFEKFIERNVMEGFPFFSVLLRRCDYGKWEEIAKHQIFTAFGRNYGLTGDDRDKQTAFNQLVEFDRNGDILPSAARDKYFENLVDQINKALNPIDQ